MWSGSPALVGREILTACGRLCTRNTVKVTIASVSLSLASSQSYLLRLVVREATLHSDTTFLTFIPLPNTWCVLPGF